MRIDLTYTDKQIEFLSSDKKFTIVPKGRRFGATEGMVNDSIEGTMEGMGPFLWVDTINGNIDRYVERYYIPKFKRNGIPFEFNQQKKILKFGNGYIDFRSADNPSSLEGYAYKKILLNEAGIILKDEYLFTNAILPMLADYPESKLIAAGVPKGKYLKNGQKHPFFKLYERAINGHPDYAAFQYSSYDNPFLTHDAVKQLEMEIAAMSDLMVQQEIYGQFVEYSGSNPFIYNFDEVKHIGKVAINPNRQIVISVDFNIDPLCAIIVQTDFINYCYVIDEVAVTNANIGKFVDEVKTKYQRYLPTCIFTGDAMGKQRNIGVRDNYSNYEQIQMGLGLSSKQIDVKGNPTHENSRADCNYFLAHFPDFKISDKCVNTIRDLKYVQADGHGSIIKENRKVATQQSDTLDCFRYLINTFFKDWIAKHQKINLSLNYERQISADPRINKAINNLANNGLNA